MMHNDKLKLIGKILFSLAHKIVLYINSLISNRFGLVKR